MHETVIATEIINAAKKHGKVMSIVVEVGDIAPLSAEEMEKTLKNMVDWNVEIKRKKAEVKCQCGYLGEPKIIERTHHAVVFECPKCGKIPAIVTGKNIILKQAEVE